jgi:tetratricopeptide (TPR) repeat protein
MVMVVAIAEEPQVSPNDLGDLATPLCFVLMPFGVKSEPGGRVIDFDAVYADVIRPAIEGAGMEPLRADEKQMGGIIHKPMFECLLLCPYAVADLTSANANVAYELGIRHAARPSSTVAVAAVPMTLPFDLGPNRTIGYELDSSGRPAGVETTVDRLRAALDAARCGDTASPVFQLLPNLRARQLDHEQTEAFQERVRGISALNGRISRAREAGVVELQVLEANLSVSDLPVESAVDLFLAYRAVNAWEAMVACSRRLNPALARTRLVREQTGLALNRLGRRDEAERVLQDVLDEFGPSSETYGILGRVFKDRWVAKIATGHRLTAAGYLARAIECYRRGFEADWRDHYPGINAVTLLRIQGSAEEVAKLEPLVRYAVERKLARDAGDYWDRVTVLELDVAVGDEAGATGALPTVLASMRYRYEGETTRNNLELIRRHGPTALWLPWMDEVVEALGDHSEQLHPTFAG